MTKFILYVEDHLYNIVTRSTRDQPAHVYMPQDAPLINILEVQMTGADLHLVNGLINDAGREAAAAAAEANWFDVSTLKEPYRIEGKKIMGYEVAMAFDWQLPDVIIYPTGGGTGLIGMWKAFDEMESLGWLAPDEKILVFNTGTGLKHRLMLT